MIVVAGWMGWVSLCSAQLRVDHAGGPEPTGLVSMSLGDSLARARLRNPEVVQAQSGLTQAQADVLVAVQRPNPQLTTGVGAINPSRGIGSGGLLSKTVDSSVRIDQLIERGGKAGLRVAAATQSVQAVSQDLEDVLRQQWVLVQGAYFDLKASQARVELAQDNMRLYRDSVAAAEKRQQAGDLAGADVARIRMDLLRSENDAQAARADLLRAQLSLGYLIGFAGDEFLPLAVSPWPQSGPIDKAPDLIRLVDQRADVQAATYRIAAFEKQRDLALAQKVRDVSLGIQYDHYPVSAANASGSGNSVAVSLSIPLFLRHQNEGTIARAQSDLDAAKAARAKAVASALTELRALQATLRAAQDRHLRYQNALLPQALKGMSAAEFAFRNGALAVMDYLDARRVLQQVQGEAIQARADVAKAWTAWIINTGSQAQTQSLLSKEGQTP